MNRALLSLFFYANLAIVLAIAAYRAYLYAAAPDASALLVRQIDKIEAVAAEGGPLRFAVVGEGNNSIGMLEREVIPRINASDVDFVVSAGNIVSGGGEDKYRSILQILSHLDIPYLLTFGENEFEEFGSTRFYQRFGPHFYSIALPQARLVFLDATGHTPTDWQERWLRDILQSEETRPVIVFVGHPLVAPEHETLFEPDRGAWSEPDDRDRLLGLFRRLGVDMVISAGAATYSDQVVDGIRHIVTGGAGGFVVNDETSFYHYLDLSADRDGIQADLVRIDTAPTPLAQRVEGLWFFVYSLFYVGWLNFLAIFSAFVLTAMYLYNRLFRERRYYPDYDLRVPVDPGRPLRIAMFTNTYLPSINGVAVSVNRLKTGLERQGHEVLLCAPSYDDQRPEAGVFRIPILISLGAAFRLANPFHRQTWRTVREFQPDVVHLHHPYWLGSLGLRMARKLKVPSVFTYHTRLEQLAHAIPLPGALFRNVIAHWLVRRFANRCDEIIVPTPIIRDYIHLIGVDRPVHVHPTGIEVERFRRRNPTQLAELAARFNPDGRRILVTIARLSKEKNLDFLIAAMKELKARQAPPFRLLIIGDGDERARLTSTIRDAGLTSEVRLVGSVPMQDIPAYLALAQLFVFTSVSETQGMVILEAMAAGLPVVAVNATGVDAFVQNRRTGMLTEEDLDAWTDAVHALLVNRSERQKMARAALEEAQTHSIERFAADIARVYLIAIGAWERAGKEH
ncbi:glycosyltransferase [Jhaorihella thermophila]|uniref:Glycosyltransferase involved in cell wall bisynthesis n=1 Tax=Jhaorihella thermophila TaxID=488547 RepID=A0A1H5YWH9_9RHOB|nr:glycosyltransferase [Jhaorihella thermophila]SEG27847.1 Glycosyltransferase involved in cell wall bisynthesis [Jhaorihella thermophila]